jgi:Ca-activated chloride channel family protein
MRCQLSSRFVACSLAVLVSTAAALACADNKTASPTLTSPTRVLKAIDYTGPLVLESAPTNDASADHSLAPYLYVAGGDPERDQVPLKKTWAQVDIAGIIAAVKVHQIFANTGKRPIEAVYVFPASTRAAVHAMRLKIGARTVEAKIERKSEARAQYEAAKQEGKRASLLEQQRPNVFTTSVANIMPGDRIEVELDYSELLIPENSTYEFVYPTVVGPRYAGGADAKTAQWMANPHLPEGKAEPYAWDLKVHLQTGIGLKEVSSPSHKIIVRYAGPSAADIALDQTGGGTKDFVLRYRLAGDKIETGLLQFEEPAAGLGRPSEKFFALMIEPPQRPSLADIPGREYIFLLDVSGSMHGFPIETSKTLMRQLLSSLRSTDHFNIVCFSGANYVWSPSGSRRATEDNIREGIDVVLKQNGGGGTELMGGLQAAYAIPPVGQGIARTVVVATDGYVGIEAQAFRFIRDHLDEANLFAFGIGNSVNRALIEGMARAGLGEPFVVLGPEKAAAEADKLRQMIDRPLLTDISLRFDDGSVYEVAPEKIPDLLAERPLLIYGKYRGDRPSRIEITGRTGRGAYHQAIDVRPADARQENRALRALWARKWTEVLEDELHMGGGKPVEDAITNLGLFYNLLTPFTSFVAVDSEIANRTGQSDTVRQPLPMPEGVSNYAVAEKKSAFAFGRLRAKPTAAEPALGFLSPVTAAAPMPAQTPVSGSKGKVRSRGLDVSDELSAAKEKDKATEATRKSAPERRACTAVLSVHRNEHLTDLKALRELIEHTARSQGCRMHDSVRLRLVVDASGTVTHVIVVSGNQTLGALLGRKLTGASSATRSDGQASGSIELTVALSF